MGIRTQVSHNPAITLGGLRQGVTPLDMAHAYQTHRAGRAQVSGTLGASRFGPVGIQEVVSPADSCSTPHHGQVPPPCCRRASPTETSMLNTVLRPARDRPRGLNGRAAGKTGTTANYGDAWFVGSPSLHGRRVGRLPRPPVPMKTPLWRTAGARPARSRR